MENLKTLIHWLSYCYYLYIFGYAGLFKVIQKPQMMQSMESLGFNKTWTIFIGFAEIIGVAALLAGIVEPKLKNAAVLYLFPFAVGAFVTHMAHQEYRHFYNSLIVCILSIILLLTDKQFYIRL